MLSYAHEQKYMGVRLIGVANKTQFLRLSWALPNDTTISTASLRLRVPQTPRSRDLTMFVSPDDRLSDNPIALPLAAHARAG
jgi:hypothetical protein